MKNIIYIIAIILNYNILIAQEFIDNNDYVYAEGYGNTIEEADKHALSLLANNIKVNVKSFSEYYVKANGYDMQKSYSEKIITFTDIIIKDSQVEVIKLSNDYYHVYRYINKKEYVNNRLNKIKKILDVHKKYGRTGNLILGEYYYAYCIYDDDLMELFYPQSITLKKELKNKAINLQKSVYVEETSKLYFNVENDSFPLYGIDYQLINNECFDLNNFYFKVMGPYAYKLNFEIKVGDKWIKDYIKSIGNDSSPLYCVKCNLSLPRNIFYKSDKLLEYRVIYEIIDDFNNRVKIDVPNDWYVINIIKMASYNDIIKWINNDIERKFISYKEGEIIKNYMFN